MSTARRFSILLFLTLLVTACGHSTGNRDGSDVPLQRMYIDANLFFAMALPEQWMKVDPEKWPAPGESSVAWRSKGQNTAGQPDVMLRVISQPPSATRGGFTRMKWDFLHERPGIKEISSRERVANNLPAMEMIGSLPDRKVMAVFITTSRRAFTIEFACLTSEFEVYHPLFEEILQSFNVL